MGKPRHEYIYGINPCFEVVRGGRRRIHQAFVAENGQRNPRIKKLVQYLTSQEIPIEWVQRDRLFQLSKSKENQGAVIKTSLYKYVDFESLMDSHKILLLDNVEDPHNVGAIIRSAEIFGFHTILLPLRGVPEVYPSVVKVSAGATEHLKIAKETSANNYVKRALECDFTIVALDADGKDNITELGKKSIEKLLLVIGGEGASVRQFILNNAQHVASINQFGKINSLNASVAAGIAMYALGGKDAD